MLTTTQLNALNTLVTQHSDEVIARTVNYYLNSGIWTDLLTDADTVEVYKYLTQYAVDELNMWDVFELMVEQFNYELEGMLLIHDLYYSEMLNDEQVEQAVKHIAEHAMQLV